MTQILVATDFSDGARRALTVGAHYARVMHACIHLLHISPAAGMDAMQPLEDVTADAGRDVSLTIVGRSGEPAEEIIRYAASYSIDLIVMGTHGRTGFSRVLLGSGGARASRRAVPCARGPATCTARLWTVHVIRRRPTGGGIDDGTSVSRLRGTRARSDLRAVSRPHSW
jgi:hypothetical protein